MVFVIVIHPGGETVSKSLDRALFIPHEQRQDMVSVCAEVAEKFEAFAPRWERIAQEKGARPVGDWHKKKTWAFHSKKTKTYYRHYELDDTPFLIFFDTKDERILIGHGVSSPDCEETEEAEEPS